MSTTRLVEDAASGSMEALIQVLRITPRPTILISFVRPYVDLHPRLSEAGVAMGGLFIIDATPQSTLEAFRPDAFFVGSPTLLERVGMVCEKVLPRLGGHADIVVFDHDTIVSYNGVEVTQQFMHHLIGQAQRNECDVRVLVQSPPEALCAISDKVERLEELA